MKKRQATALAFALMALITTKAQDRPAFNYKVSEVSLTSFHRLVVNTDADVVLLQNDTLKKAFIEGDEKLVAGIKIFIANDVMTISSTRPSSSRGKVQVTVAVNNLSRLEINAAAGVASINTLQTPELSVIVNGDCHLQLCSTGHISFTGAGTHEVAYVRTEKNASRKIDYYENLSN